jgi:hypothetical protein
MKRDPRQFANDPRSTLELVGVALSGWKNDRAWNAIHVLRTRGSDEVFDAACHLAYSGIAAHREVGAHILAQLGSSNPTLVEESVSILLDLLADKITYVLCATIYGLGHRRNARAVPHLLKFQNHSNSGVRQAVAFSLGSFSQPESISGLIELSKDKAVKVRDWATFGLGTLQSQIDIEDVRDALHSRLNESDPEIRGEALIGLAHRKDPRVIEPLKKELQGRFHGDWTLEAAELLALEDLYPLLKSLRNRWSDDDEARFHTSMEDALKACQPKK